MSTPQHPFQANTDKDSLLSVLIPVVEEEKARLPADRRFRTMTPNSEWADVILIRLWFTNMLGIEMCTASNCGFFSSLCYDCLPLPFRVSSSMWILRVRMLNNTRQLINPHWVMNLFCFSAGRLSFSKQECGFFFLFFFFFLEGGLSNPIPHYPERLWEALLWKHYLLLSIIIFKGIIMII